MAFTASFVTDSVMGKYRLRVHDVTADAATGSLNTGLKRITWAILTPKAIQSYVHSGNTAYTSPTYYENALPEATAALGYVALSGVVSGDIYRVTSFGPS